MSDAQPLLRTLAAWREHGWIRRLDSAFAAFMVELCPNAPATVVMAAALVAHMEGRGHTCLSIDELFADADAVLGWAPLASAAWADATATLPSCAQDWLDALRASPLVAEDGRAGGPADAAHIHTRAGAHDHPPLVLRGSKLYLRRGWEHEQRVAEQVLRRAARCEPADAVDVTAARHWLDRLFPPAAAPPGDGLAPIDWQKVACAIALRARLSIITGGPGTGKTHTAARLLALLFAVDPAPQRLRIALAAPTGKAAARLRQSIAAALHALAPQLDDTPSLHDLAARIGPARTLHALLGARPETRRFQADAAHPLELDVLVVDEASMVHLEMMAALLAALPARARVVFLGDKDQLASVEAGAVLGDLCGDAAQGRYTPATAAFVAAVTGQQLPADCLGDRGGDRAGDGSLLAQQTVMLRQSHRFGGRIGALALAVNAGDANAAAALLPSNADEPLRWLDTSAPSAVVRLAVQGRPGAPGGYGAYLQALQQRPASDDRASHEAWAVSVLSAFERFRVLCAVHDGEWGTASLNLAIERALAADGLLVKRGEWYEGRPVMVTRNDAGLGVFNGDIGIALRPLACTTRGEAGGSLRAFFLDGNALRSVGVSRLSNVETAFAMTVHKSQGSEFEHTVLVLPAAPSRVLTRELVYTGITRARLAFTLVTGRRQAFTEALARRTRRSSGLLELLEAAPPAQTASRSNPTESGTLLNI